MSIEHKSLLLPPSTLSYISFLFSHTFSWSYLFSFLSSHLSSNFRSVTFAFNVSMDGLGNDIKTFVLTKFLDTFWLLFFIATVLVDHSLIHLVIQQIQGRPQRYSIDIQFLYFHRTLKTF